MHLFCNKAFYIKLIIVCILILVCFTSIAFAGPSFVEWAESPEKPHGKVSLMGDEALSLTKEGTELPVFYFQPTKTGLYRINVNKLVDFNTTDGYQPVSYRLDRLTVMQLSTKFNYTNVSLASEKSGGDVHLANINGDAYNTNKTSVSGWGTVAPNDGAAYVILDENSVYAIRLQEDPALHAYIQIQKKNEKSGATYGVSPNFPSAWVTMGKKNTSIFANDPVIENYYKMEVPVARINEVVNELKLEDVSTDDHSFQWLESILIYIIFGIGNLFIKIFEETLGVKGLTLDGIIFNKMGTNTNNPTIDLRPLGGISLGTDYDGILSEPAVATAVSTIFGALKTIVLVFYVIILLYVGVRILMSVGTKDEPKSKKFLQYWLTGLLILMVFPYFMPAIPYINNQLVTRLSEKANSSAKYSLEEIKSTLSDKFRGEDAEVILLEETLEDRIKKLSSLLRSGDAKLTADEALAVIEEKMGTRMTATTLSGLSDADKTNYTQKYRRVASTIYANIADWDTSAYAKQYIDDLYDIRDFIYNNHQTIKKYDDITRSDNYYYNSATREWLKLNTISGLSDEDRGKINNELIVIARYLQKSEHFDRTTGNIKSQREYTNALNTLKSILRKYCSNDDAESRVNTLSSSLERGSYFGNFFRNIYSMGKSTGIKPAFDDYIEALLTEKITVYKDMLASLNDPMIRLYKMAKEQSRVVYAIAWAILLFQVIAILFMYYKRVFVIMLLVVLFPVVMALYVIDRLGDGKAQSFENWFKEFFVNCFIQFLHAVVYVLVVNLGIDICNMDPNRNWFFLIIAVTSLFPIERMVRQIVGLNASTVGGLKNNIMGLVVAGAALTSTGKNLVHMGAGAGKAGIGLGKSVAEQHRAGQSFGSIAGSIGREKVDAMVKSFKDVKKPIEEKRNRKSQLRQSRSDNRAYRQQAAQNARAAIKGGVGTLGDRIDIARGAVANVTGVVSNTMNKVRSSKVGRVGAKISNGLATTKAYGGKALKMTAGGLRKVGGTAAGIVAGMEAAADSAVANGEGFAAGVTAGRKAIHEFGGYKDHAKPNKDGNPAKAPSNFANSYSSRRGTGGVAGGDGAPSADDSGSYDVNARNGEEISPEGAALVGGAATMAAMAMNSGSEDESNSNFVPEEVPAEDVHEEKIEVKQDIVRETDGEGNVKIEGTSETTTEGVVNQDVSVETNIHTDTSGATDVEAGVELKTDGDNTLTHTTNNDGDISEDKRNL